MALYRGYHADERSWQFTQAAIAAGADPKKALEHYADAQDSLLDEADLSTEEGRRAEYERLLATQSRVRELAEQSRRAASPNPPPES